MSKSTETKLALLSKAIGAGWWQWEATFKQSQCDEQMLSLFGVSSEDFLEAGAIEFLKRNCCPDDIHDLERGISATLSNGDELDVEFRLLATSKQYKVRCLAFAEMDESGKVNNLTGVCFKTKASQLQAKVEMLEDVLYHIPNQVFWKDKQLNYLGCNNVFSNVVGLSHPREVVGKSDFDFARSSEHAQLYRDDDQRIMDNGREELYIEEPYHKSDGTEGFVLTSKVPLKNHLEEVYGILGICTDITATKRAEAQLVFEKHRFSSVIDNMPMGYHLWELDRDGALLFKGGNEAAEKILKFRHQQFMDMKLEEIFPGLKDTELADRCKRVARDGGYFEHESLNYKDERIDSVFFSVYFQCYPGAIVSVFHDISGVKKKEIELSTTLKKLKLVTEGSSDGFWHWLDPGTDRVEWSDRFFTMLGYKPQEFVPSFSHFQTMLHPDDLELTLEALNNAIQNHEIFDMQYRIQHKDCTYQWYRGRGTPYYNEDGQLLEMAGSISNIETIKSLENSLRVSNTELEQFAYVASHDLKEPTRTLYTFSSYLLEDLKANRQDRVEKDIQYIQAASKRMMKLIGDLLEFSRAGNVELTKSFIDLPSLMGDVKNSLLSQIEASKAIIVNDLDVSGVFADPTLFGLVIQNILQNAMKFKGESQAPHIIISSEIKDDYPGVIIHIQDNGIGIDELYQDQIFGVFQRLHSIDKYPGTGIGLAIVWKILQRHGGHIKVDSTPGEGSCFSLYLPNGE